MRHLKFVATILYLFSFQAHAVVEVKELTTPAGIKVWFSPHNTSSIVSMSYSFWAGGVTDAPEKMGTADIAAEMLGEGAGEFDKKALEEQLQDFAIRMAFSNSLEHLSGSMMAPKEFLGKAATLTRLALTQPRLKQKDFKRLVDEQLIQIANEEKNPNHLADRALLQSLFPGHPYSNELNGTRDTVKKITLQDVKQYLDNYLAQDNLLVAITGDLSEQDAMALVDSIFATLPKKAKTVKLPATPKVDVEEIKVVDMAIPQSVVSFGQYGPKVDDPEILKSVVLLHIIGGNDTARMMMEIREDRGLAYYANAGLYAFDKAGMVYGSLATANEKVNESISITQDIWQRIQKDGPTQEELDNTKKLLIGSYPMRFTNSGLITKIMLGYMETRKPVSYFTERKKLIEDISIEDIRTTASNMLTPQQLTFVVVGQPAKKNG
ncbi:MAG: M16 family metallopeptidase [Alphaproteobacteria bacterium]